MCEIGLHELQCLRIPSLTNRILQGNKLYTNADMRAWLMHWGRVVLFYMLHVNSSSTVTITIIQPSWLQMPLNQYGFLCVFLFVWTKAYTKKKSLIIKYKLEQSPEPKIFSISTLVVSWTKLIWALQWRSCM